MFLWRDQKESVDSRKNAKYVELTRKRTLLVRLIIDDRGVTRY